MVLHLIGRYLSPRFSFVILLFIILLFYYVDQVKMQLGEAVARSKAAVIHEHGKSLDVVAELSETVSLFPPFSTGIHPFFFYDFFSFILSIYNLTIIYTTSFV